MTDARVAFLGASGEVQAANTDASGTCELPRAGEVELYVLRRDALLVRTRADLSSEVSRATLAKEAEVSGVLELVDGSSPEELDLHLASDRTAPEIAVVDGSVLSRLGMPEGRRSFARTKLDASGHFSFRGLPAGWSGTLRLPSEVWLRDEGGRDRASDVVLGAPARGLRLRVEHRPAVHGTLVDAESRSPIAHARGNARIRLRSGGDMIHGLTADARGRFRLAGQDPAEITALELPDLRGPYGRPFAVRKIELGDRADRGDLGEVACEAIAVRMLRIVVVDQDAQPLPDAVILAKGFEEVRADEHGRAELPWVPIAGTEIRIRARGFATAILDSLSAGEAEQTVALAPTNELAIRVDAKSSPADFRRVAIVSTAALFGPADSRARDRESPRVAAGSHSGGSFRLAGTRFETRFEADEEGRVVVEELRPAIAFEVLLLDPFGRPIASAACPPLGATEHREVDLRPEHATRAVAGRIVDAEGRPIASANILFSGGESGFGVVGGPDGRFGLEHALDGELGVGISKRGYAPASLRASDFPADGSELEVRLERAHDVRVSLVDTRGSPIAGARVDAARVASVVRLEEVSPGEFSLRDEPDAEVTFLVEVGGGFYERRHRTSDPVARIELPEHGRVEVVWPADLASDKHMTYQVALHPLDRERRALVEWIAWFPKPAEARFPAVLPGDWTIAIEAAEKRPGEGEPRFSPLHERKAIEVRAGETTRVELGP